MKKIKTIMAMFFVAATMAFVGCDKNNQNAETPTSLAGTTWVGGHEVDVMNQHYKLDIQAIFTNDSVGEMSATMTMGDEPSETETAPFTYTYEAPNGTISGVDEEGVTHETPFKVDGNNLTITWRDITVILIRQ